MQYTDKAKAVKQEALRLLKKDKLTKREMRWFNNKVIEYADTDDVWVTQVKAEIYDTSPKILKTFISLVDKEYKLSKRENEVFKLLKQGVTLKAVSEILNINYKTVYSYKARIIKKLSN